MTIISGIRNGQKTLKVFELSVNADYTEGVFDCIVKNYSKPVSRCH